MTILLPALSFAFAAFCVWLVVRIMNRRERWAKWALAGILLTILVVYPLSFGPAEYLKWKYYERDWLPTLEEQVYRPFLIWIEERPCPLPDWYTSYIEWWTLRGFQNPEIRQLDSLRRPAQP